MNKSWITKLLGASSEVSSKRVITFMAFLCLVAAFALDITMDVHVDPNLIKVMEYIVIAGLGFVASEKLFSFIGGTKTEVKSEQ